MNQFTSPAASITKAANQQTYYIFRFLVDRQRVPDAYRAYAYFRWIDDQVDQEGLENSERVAFIDHQKALMESCYRGQRPGHLTIEEQMLADLILADPEKNSGLQSYIRNMMAVIDFDAQRKGRLISRQELSWYTRSLAISVTEALLYFIGHDQSAPRSEARYIAAAGAHITHLLRDTLEDIQVGYYNIPREYLANNRISPQDVESDPYRAWVKERVHQARTCLKSGKEYLTQVKNIRCRIAAYSYIARFEGVLDVIERMEYQLASEYPEVRGLGAGMRMGGSVLSLTFFPSLRKS
jgi:phytoene/squalene synthetase